MDKVFKFPIKENYKNGAEYRWNNKKILKEKILFAGNSLNNIEPTGITNIELNDKIVLNYDKSVLIKAYTNVENIIPRPNFGLKVNLNGINLEEYNRTSLWIYPKAVGYYNFYYHISLKNSDSYQLHAPSLKPNQWNHVSFEIGKLNRNNVEYISISPFLMGCPPEALPEYEVYVDKIVAEKVKEDYDLGWELNDRIAYCHSGYFVEQDKRAISGIRYSSFSIIDKENNVIYSNKVQKVKTDLGEFYILDFSKLKIEGYYKIKYGETITNEFEISANPFINSMLKSLNFLKSLRCGEEVVGVHSPCHLNCRTYHSDGRSVPNFGGWHDAGDVSQFEIPTAEITHSLLDLTEKYTGTIKDRIKEEARIGLNWLLRTRFNDGFRVTGVTYSIWRDNILHPENKTINYYNPENGPFENFCAAAAEAKAAKVFMKEDPVFSSWCLRAAIEDFEFAKEGYKKGIFTKRWGSNNDAQVSGHGALAAAELFSITNDSYYIVEGSKYAKTILSCQQNVYPNWEIPIRGFFYEDIDHKFIMSYEHRGHEQSPIQGLAKLIQVVDNHEHKNDWINGLLLYKEYIESTIKYTNPYGLLPGHIYHLDKINLERVTYKNVGFSDEKALIDLKNQIKMGIRLEQSVFLRKMPIAIQRRGYHATLLSKAKAVSLIANILDDKHLKQIAINQLEWILGKNPFASSSMFGEGYNYHPLYVAFSDQIVGSLPVGFKTLGDLDAPYWPTINNAVFKEIWGHTTAKYLWILADL
ncbi:MAG: glycoside hydrolase family 9 protein [Bacilli bacterium]|jgi:hypothetical protein